MDAPARHLASEALSSADDPNAASRADPLGTSICPLGAVGGSATTEVRSETDEQRYSFLPWLRRGIATRITARTRDRPPAPASTVKLRIDGDAAAGRRHHSAEVEHDVQLYGPGDVIGVDPRAIVRTEPRDWVTNFDPNYLPFIEFYEEDFRWRYSPAVPDATTGRLAPWLALIVLTEEEFEDAGMPPGRPLPFITVDDLATLPPPDQLGALAHVHVNREITVRRRPCHERHGRGAAAARRRPRREPRPGLLTPDVPAPAGPGWSPTTRSWSRRSRPGGWPGSASTRPAAPGALHSSWAAYPGGRSRATSPTTTAGRSARRRRRLRVSGPAAQAADRRTPGWATATWTCRSPGAGLPGIHGPGLGGVLRLGGALKVPEPRSTRTSSTSRARTRTGTSRTRTRSRTRWPR